ncbi:MAG: hypothetical protein HIU88_01735 [Acidobacteria bacterium]|nr:hypothetical protein [Acidobacteriota bacterium]
MAQPAEGDERSFRILVVRSGGVAGITRRWQVEPGDDAEEWRELVRACPWDAEDSDTESRDRFVWRIEVSRSDGQPADPVRSASVPDAQLLGPWRTLVDRVQQCGSHG